MAVSLSTLPPPVFTPLHTDGFGVLPDEAVVVEATARAVVTERADQAGEGAPAAVEERLTFVWPAYGPISQYMGPRHPKGIDIGLAHSPDRPIWAVADGVVAFSGGVRCCEYGLFIVIEHADGFSSLYSHLDRLDVYEGQRVSRGQYIGWGGSTGISTGPHLHFELMLDDVHVDPMRFLPVHSFESTD
jgi:murein DD-endopeptidase MepM/ murein hydrolase activator NlpD